jgi:hypothetical protein
MFRLLLVSFFWMCDSASVQSKLLMRRIQSKPNDILHALDVLSEAGEDDQEDGPFLAALRVCGKSNSPDVALQIYNRHPSPACETLVISVLGSCQQYLKAVELLLESKTTTRSAGSFNAALAACGKAKDWKLALDIYENHKPIEQKISTLTTNVVLNILSNCRQGAEALRVLDNTMSCEPDRVSYQHVFSALIRSEMVDEASDLLARLRQNPAGIQPSEDIFDLVVGAYGKASNWDAIQKVEQIRFPNTTIDAREKYSFQYLDSLTKVGKRKEAYREIATYTPWNLTIGVQSNRNPAKNGIRLVFYENSVGQETRTKLGYLLMINSGDSSSLLGMFVEGQHRGRGLAKVCFATWLWFCLKADILPKTGRMNKPLISLLLQYRFGFTPAKGGVQVEVASDPDDADKTLVYAKSKKSLEGTFCPRDLQHQNIRLSLTPPDPRGRMVSVGTTLEAPDKSRLQEMVTKILPAGTMNCQLSPSEVRLIYLGKK